MFFQERHHLFTPMKRRVSVTPVAGMCSGCPGVHVLCGQTITQFFSLACVAIRRGFGFSGIGTIDVFVKYELEVSDTHQTNKTKHRQLPPAFP